MRQAGMQRVGAITLAALMMSSVVALPASAAVSGVCGSNSKLSATTPYNDDGILQHLISTRGSLACGSYSASHQWQVKVVLQEYYRGAWHSVASATSSWRTAKSGTVTTGSASVFCLTDLIPYRFRAQATAYWRSSSKSSTKTLSSTYSSTVTRNC